MTTGRMLLIVNIHDVGRRLPGYPEVLTIMGTTGELADSRGAPLASLYAEEMSDIDNEIKETGFWINPSPFTKRWVRCTASHNPIRFIQERR